ncbi:MAG: sel1 repeat family protein [Gammaproteobacteria bacterium]|nr:MAG: sel1 repeat family protein [Gammaproteobacteria bacterium]
MNRELALIAILCISPLGGWASDTQSIELKMIAQEAQNGDPGAELLYGLAFLEGRYGLKVDARKAVQWLERSAKDGNSYAQLVLGNCYAEGKGVKADPAEAVKWWRKAAEAGNSEAQYRLGKAYLDGFGVAKDDQRAVEWLKRAAANGNPRAEYLIGKMYHEGYILVQDQTLAKDWLSRAASHGYQNAINLLEVINVLLKSTTLESQASYAALKEKAEQGDPHAQYELALRYETGAFDVNADPAKALYWLTQAAKNGNLLAMKHLADVYEKGLLGVKKDPQKAAYWRKKSMGKY